MASRRDYLQAAFASILVGNQLTAASGATIDASNSPSSQVGPHLMTEYYQNTPDSAPLAGRSYFPTLTPPFRNRATYRYDLGRNAYALEQLLTFGNVTATIRTNVIRLRNGGLWVHGPQWPTGEFCQLLDELGPVQHVVLPCNALEHKAPMRAFLKRYPQASVWVAPGQYGLFGSCGKDNSNSALAMGYRVDGILSPDMIQSANAPEWLDEFDFRTLYVNLPQNSGPVSEVAFYHRPTTTLIVTDALVFIPPEPSPIFRTYFDETTISDPSFWPKTVLQSVFLPLRTASDGSVSPMYPGYKALENRLVRAPILRAFNDARAPTLTREWIQQIGQWRGIDRILSSHFASPVAATAQNVVDAFSYLSDGDSSKLLPPIACQDWQLLDGLNQFISSNNLGAPVVYDFQRGCI